VPNQGRTGRRGRPSGARRRRAYRHERYACAGISLADKQATTRALLACGAAIGEINTVRKHLSRIKGGRLAQRAYPARVVSVAISDVPGGDPAIIGSGPTVPDASTLEQSRAIVERYRLDLPESVVRALRDGANETPKPGNQIFTRTSFSLAARPADVFNRVEEAVRAAGYETILLGTQIEGEARTVAGAHAQCAKELAASSRRAVILSGGELTVTVRGKGRGGPNQVYALALAIALAGLPSAAALGGDTDGTDGGGGRAGRSCGRLRRYHDARARPRAGARSGGLSG
jgi:glycerate 2-kinase